MSKFNMKFSYKELQIIKHAITHYTWRHTATKKELEEENRLLHKITEHVDEIKEKINIG